MGEIKVINGNMAAAIGRRYGAAPISLRPIPSHPRPPLWSIWRIL